jgi:CheY-like chemotaxis protein
VSDATTSLNRLEALNRLVARGGSSPEILAAAVHVVQRWFTAEWCSILVPSTGSNRLSVCATTGQEAHEGTALIAAEAVATQVAETGEIQIDCGLIGAPAVSMGTFRGALVVSPDEAHPFDEWDLRTLGLAASCVATVLAQTGSAPVRPAAAADAGDAEQLRKLARRIAHGLNNSLMPIVGHAELMLEDARAQANQDFQEGCTIIRENGYEAARLIRQLLELGAQPEAASSPRIVAPGAVPAVVPAGAPRFESHRVLVVDDDDRMLELIEAVLRSKLGCRVERASNGADAASAIDHTEFNLVLSDVLMPRMNGVELMEWIDQHQPQVAERLVFMTGDANPRGPGDELRRAGRPVLAKPFSLDALIAVAESVLRR